MKPLQTKLTKTVMRLYLFCTALIFVQIYAFNDAYGYGPLLQGVLVALYLACLAGVCFFCARTGVLEKLCRRKYLVLFCALVFLFCVQFAIGLATRQNLNHDYGKVVNGAMLYAEVGRTEAFTNSVYNWYLHHWTNNLGEFALLVPLFRAVSALGLSCHYEVLIALGCLCFTLSVLCTFLYADKAFGEKPALFSLLLFLSFGVVYFQASAVYTDTCSVWAAPAALLFWEKGKQAGGGRRLGFWAASALCVAGGTQLKGTVAIVGIAILCEAVLTLPLRQTAAAFAVAVLTFAAANTAFSGVYHAMVLDDAYADRVSMPVAFWVMMGLAGENGTYTPLDEDITMWGATKAERADICIQQIKNRLQERGWGYFAFLHRKTTRTFGSGNADIQYMLSRGPLYPERAVYAVILPEGRFFRYFDNVTQCVYLAFYLLGMLGAALALRQKRLLHIAPQLAIVGFYVFMLLWEANQRQLVNQWPILILCGVGALAGLLAKSENKSMISKEKIAG